MPSHYSLSQTQTSPCGPHCLSHCPCWPLPGVLSLMSLCKTPKPLLHVLGRVYPLLWADHHARHCADGPPRSASGVPTISFSFWQHFGSLQASLKSNLLITGRMLPVGRGVSQVFQEQLGRRHFQGKRRATRQTRCLSRQEPRPKEGLPGEEQGPLRQTPPCSPVPLHPNLPAPKEVPLAISQRLGGLPRWR